MMRRSSRGPLRRKADQNSLYNQRNLARVYDLYLQANEEVKRLQKSEKETAQKLRRAETEVAKSKKLSQEVTKLQKELSYTQRQLAGLEHKYNALSHSKLGRLTLKKWERRKRKREKAEKSAGLTYNSGDSISTIPGILEATPIDTEKLENFVAGYSSLIDRMEDSTGSRYYKKLDARVGIICDEFLWDSLYPAADFVYLTPDNSESIIAQSGIDVFLLVSTWRGINQEWVDVADSESSKRDLVYLLIEQCREKQIPVIFYSKEDPTNYSTFLELAQQADYVLTSAVEMIPEYKKDCGHDRVSSVMFGINPLLHNPISTHNSTGLDSVLFAGSWNDRYPDRGRDMSVLFDGVLSSEYNLHILDRNYGSQRYQYPARYQHYVSPAVKHGDLYKLHKVFDWALNINTIVASDSMFANRTFELLASGVSVISNYSAGVNSYLPAIFMAHESLEIPSILSTFSPEECYERQMLGVRQVYRSHTCFHRIRDILSPVLSNLQPLEERAVLVICDENSVSSHANFERQTYPYKTLITQSQLTPQILAQHDMVTWMSSDAHYGIYYLEDLVNAFKYTNSDYITKDAWYERDHLHEGIEHGYVSVMKDRSRTLFWRESFSDDFFLNPSSTPLVLDNGYSIDHLSYRLGEVPEKTKKENYQLSVVVPIYNNGEHLVSKCFTSLRRSSIFDDMEIIFVDDGSTDDFTLKVQEDLASKYSNICLYRFADNGSGSASRPRNRGVELASAEYVTFLDPDNEALRDSYAFLLQKAKENNNDLVFGGILRAANTILYFNYGARWNSKAQSALSLTTKDILLATDFLAVSIQAMVIRKSFIVENNLKQVEGAAGQDTLFSWELLCAANSVAAYKRPVHIYYAATAGSVTNTVSSKYFEKLLLLQDPKLQWLKDNGLLSEYMEKKYVPYTKGWVLRKWLSSNDFYASAEFITRYFECWNRHYSGSDELLDAIRDSLSIGDVQTAWQKALMLPSAPANNVSPIQKRKRITKSPIEYKLVDTKLYLVNLEALNIPASFSWVLYKGESGHDVCMSKPYSQERDAVFDFTDFPVGVYRIKAYRIAENGNKKTWYAVRVAVRRDYSVTVIDAYTSAFGIP